MGDRSRACPHNDLFVCLIHAGIVSQGGKGVAAVMRGMVQLTSEYGERFTEEEVQYAVDKVDADWNANAISILH